MNADPLFNADPSVRTTPTDEAPAPATAGGPRLIHRSNHPISRKDISEEALKVLYRLSSLGFKAYLVGGGVRDLYLGKKPKDYDVGTDAKPSRLKRIFRNCRIIGRRFRIAHVFFPGDKIVEVATFRRGVVHQITSESGVVLLDNEYGSPEEDARRRDITINGLFYDIATHSIIDYVGGVQDLDDRIIRTINDPDLSFVEDPVRMIRTLRHAARTAFHVEENTLRATYRNRSELQKANTSRLMEEMFKDLRGGAVEPFFKSMVETHLLDVIMPALAAQLREVGLDHPLWRRFRALDRWSQEGRETSNPVLLALFLHTVLLPEAEAWTGERGQQMDVWRTLMRNFTETSRHMRISRRDAERVAQVLISFRKLVQAYRRGHLTPIFQKKPYLADALDFLEVEFSSRGEPVELIAQWRKEFIGERPGRPSRLPFGAGGFLGGRGGRGRRGRGHLEGGGPPGGETEEMEGGEEIAGEMSGELGAAGGPHGTATEGPGTATGGRAAGGTVTGGTAGGGGEPGGERRRRRRRRGGRRRKSRHRGD